MSRELTFENFYQLERQEKSEEIQSELSKRHEGEHQEWLLQHQILQSETQEDAAAAATCLVDAEADLEKLSEALLKMQNGTKCFCFSLENF